MKKTWILLLILHTCYSIAQSSKLDLKFKQALPFYTELSTSTLFIPITSSKDAEEKALLHALKKYWTICPYKTISRKTFNEIQSNHTATPPNTFYLVRETYERLKAKKKDWAYTKYYITKQNHWIEEEGQPFIEFKLPLRTINGEPKELSYSYLYDLMIRNLNAELLLMKNPEAYAKAFSRKKLLKVNFKHSLKPYAEKKLLVSKNELENYMMNLPDDRKDNTIQEKRFIKFISKKTKIHPDNIKMTSEEDIKKSIDKADPTTLIYTGYSIYNTQDALMLRRIDPHRGARPFHWVLAITISLAVIATASLLTGIL